MEAFAAINHWRCQWRIFHMMGTLVLKHDSRPRSRAACNSTLNEGSPKRAPVAP